MRSHKRSRGTPRVRETILHLTREESLALEEALINGRALLNESPDQDSSSLVSVGVELDNRQLLIRIKKEVL